MVVYAVDHSNVISRHVIPVTPQDTFIYMEKKDYDITLIAQDKRYGVFWMSRDAYCTMCRQYKVALQNLGVDAKKRGTSIWDQVKITEECITQIGIPIKEGMAPLLLPYLNLRRFHNTPEINHIVVHILIKPTQSYFNIYTAAVKVRPSACQLCESAYIDRHMRRCKGCRHMAMMWRHFEECGYCSGRLIHKKHNIHTRAVRRHMKHCKYCTNEQFRTCLQDNLLQTTIECTCPFTWMIDQPIFSLDIAL